MVFSQFPTRMLKFSLYQSQFHIFIPSLLRSCSCKSTFSCRHSLSHMLLSSQQWRQLASLDLLLLFHHPVCQLFYPQDASEMAPKSPVASFSSSNLTPLPKSPQCCKPPLLPSNLSPLGSLKLPVLSGIFPSSALLFLLPFLILYAPMSFMITFRQIIVLSGRRLLSQGSLQMYRGWIELSTRYSNGSLKLVYPKPRSKTCTSWTCFISLFPV